MASASFSVLHVVGATVAGGAERVAFNLTRHLSRSGIRLGLHALSGNVDDVGRGMRESLLRDDVYFRCGPIGRVGFRAVLDYARALFEFEPTIVHLHTPNTELAHAIVGRFFGILTARTVHNSVLNRSVVQRWALHSNRVALSVACSEAVAKSNEDWVSPSQVIINGVEFDWPIQTTEEKLNAQRRLGIDPDVRHFVMVGGMRGATLSNAQKAHSVAIEAWKNCGLDPSACALHFVGDGPLRGQLERLAGSQSSIVFHGISAQVADWLLAADVFVMPSRHEGLPLAGIEALGTGLPCIFSDIPPLRELNPTNVWWCNKDDSDSLAKCFREAHLRFSRTDVTGALAFRGNFGMDSMSDNYLKYYRKLLGD